MVNIFNGNVSQRFLRDTNITRLQDFNINRFSKTILQSAAQAQREESVKKGFEFHQAMMADLQTKLGEMVEKLNNLYRKFISDRAAFRKVVNDPGYTNTSKLLNNFGDRSNPSGNTGHPAGVNNILDFQDPDRIRNYTYNPFFGSKAIDQSDQNLIRTQWQQEHDGSGTLENSYTENGAFWSSVAYLWGWDIDRFNATYATTDDTQGSVTGDTDNIQVNVTALQPNKPAFPPLQIGDRLPMVPGGASNFPYIGISGIRPGGVDYSHATTSINTTNDNGDAPNYANVNVTGRDSTNFGWEFDDLPVALEVTSVKQLENGQTVPDGYRVVYDIPASHPFYDEVKVLDGTEPMIIDAPTEIRKDRINNPGFDYSGSLFFPGSNIVNFTHVVPGFGFSCGGTGCCGGMHCEATENPPPRLFSPVDTPAQVAGSFELSTCSPVSITANTKVSFKYRYRVRQSIGVFTSPNDDPGAPPRTGYQGHDWNSAGGRVVPGGNDAFVVGMPGTFNTVTNADATTTLLSLGTNVANNAFATDLWKTSGREELFVKIAPGTTANDVRFDVFFDGDINGLEIEVTDLQIVTYDGTFNSWEQGKYNSGNVDPIVEIGDPTTAQQANSPDEVISKYYPNIYQFTQFNDQYTNSYSPTDMNDIIRSPWEFAQLNIDAGSGMSGEMWMDINGRRLNLDHETLDQVETWDQGTGPVAASNTGFSMTGGGVANAWDFVPVAHPTDACGNGLHAAQMNDSDPRLSNFNQRTTILQDEWNEPGGGHYDPGVGNANDVPIAAGDLDPGRTSNPGFGAPGTFYGNFGNAAGTTVNNPTNFVTGASNDTTGTVDRVLGSDPDISYKITIPTDDVNVLRKENNLLVNFGAVEDRDYTIDLNNMYMETRTALDYKTMPRYRVDEAGNIYDRFGKGYYDTANANDAASLNRLYTNSGGATGNSQVSNFNQTYNNANTANFLTSGGSYQNWVNANDRLSLGNDDYNLFDYIPDLNLVNPADPTQETYTNDYIGSVPSNFYYYREQLDNALGASPAAVSNFDGMPALNFDGYEENRTGAYTTNRSVEVRNANVPSWANVKIGVAEQDAKYENFKRTTTAAFWNGFPGVNDTNFNATLVYDAGAPTPPPPNGFIDPPNNVVNPDFILGADLSQGTTFNFPTSGMTVDLGQQINSTGTLLIWETFTVPLPTGGTESRTKPHVIPLPLVEKGVFPPVPAPFTFDAYGGAKTVLRTGSINIANFNGAGNLLDALDGTEGGAAGGFKNSAVVSTTDPPNTWGAGILLHVDEAFAFDVNDPQNQVYFGDDQANRFRVVMKDASTEPQTIILIPEGGGAVPAPYNNDANLFADLQLQEYTPQYTVDVSGSAVQIQFDDQGLQVPGNIAAVQTSEKVDKVGRFLTDDLATAAVETDIIGPEIFADREGYFQEDAHIQLDLVAQDANGHSIPRRLKKVTVDVLAGEQTIPGAISQSYSTEGPFGVNNNWPLALYEEDLQLNPADSTDIDVAVGLFQGIVSGQTGNGGPGAPLFVTSTSGFKLGQKVRVEGEERVIMGIDTVANTLTFDNPLTNAPTRGTVGLNDGLGHRKIDLFLNKSMSMAMGAPIKITMEYEEYSPQGYPPVVDMSVPGVPVTETVGFVDGQPAQFARVSATNNSDGTNNGGILVDNLGGFNVGDKVSLHGNTYTLTGASTVGGVPLALPQPAGTAGRLLIDQPFTIAGNPTTVGLIKRIDYEDYLVAGTGRTGGSFDNEFTNELKRIVDDPTFAELFRHDLFKNVFIAAAVNDPFSDLIAGKILLDWDRRQRRVEIMQTSYMAFFKSG